MVNRYFAYKVGFEAERNDFYTGNQDTNGQADFLQALVKTSRLETGIIRLEKKTGRIYGYCGASNELIVYAAENKQIRCFNILS